MPDGRVPGRAATRRATDDRLRPTARPGPPRSRAPTSASLDDAAGRPAGRPRRAPGGDGRTAARRSVGSARRSSRTWPRTADPGLVATRRTALLRLRRRRRPAGRARRPTGWRAPGTRTPALYVMSPAAAVAEEVAAAWLVELLDLPAGTSVGFVTGATMANFTALAAARHAVLARVGWDVERLGLQGAPPVTVVTHDGTHVTVYASLQMLGLGREGDRVRRIAADDQGRMRPDALREVLAGIDGPIDRVRPGRQREQRRVRPVRGDRPDRPRARGVGPRRWRVRDLGGGGAVAARADARPRARRIRGRPTPTSGSTCRTTRVWSSCATPRRITRR